MFNRGEIVEIRITDYAFGGRGLAKITKEDGTFYAVFVDNAFPGQLVRTKIDKKKKKYAEGKLLEVIERSPDEVITQFQEISGAPYIYVPVELQENLKKTATLEVYRRLGNIENPEQYFDTFISSPNHHHYRNKMEYSFSSIEHDLEKNEELDEAFALGFKRRGTWWKVESLNAASGLFDEDFENKLHEIRKYLKNTNLPAWHPPGKHGFFRHIVVRKSFHENRLLINIVTSSEGLADFDVQAFGAFIQELLPNRIAGLLHTINDNVADRAKIENGESKLVFGANKIVEILSGLEFEISMESFFQTNPACAELLYGKALDYVFESEIGEQDIVMDLFCGTGTIGQLLQKRQPNTKIIGVDIVPEAIADAQLNASRNKLQNIQFHAADVGKFLYQFPQYQGKIHTIILDPPRAGIAPKTLQKVIALGAKHIVYISCNPATQARDADELTKAGYKIDKISLVDQFPHTGHIEAIMKFSK